MIKINLTPVDELESQFFYIPELIVLIVVAVGAYMGLDYHLSGVRSEIEVQEAAEATKTQAIAQLTSDLDKFKNLNSDIELLGKRLQALTKITVSRISKYKPVIVLEHLQNLKPEGVWYTTYVNAENRITLTGVAFDNILISEFLMALRSTEAQEPDNADLRTQVYFTNIDLEYATLGADPNFSEMVDFPTFQILMEFAEKSPPAPMNDDPISMRAMQQRRIF